MGSQRYRAAYLVVPQPAVTACITTGPPPLVSEGEEGTHRGSSGEKQAPGGALLHPRALGNALVVCHMGVSGTAGPFKKY